MKAQRSRATLHYIEENKRRCEMEAAGLRLPARGSARPAVRRSGPEQECTEL